MAQRHLESVDHRLLPAVNAAITALGLTDADQAAARLAQRYAEAIDDAAAESQREFFLAMRYTAPNLLACLAELGATPVARKTVMKETRSIRSGGELERLRAARAAGHH